MRVAGAANQFQSTLAPEGASDSASRGAPRRSTSFNPRSHPRVRATITRAGFATKIRVSIHARTRGCERPLCQTVARVEILVSIHARTRGCERLRRRCDSHRALQFQSTLAPEGASDLTLSRRRTAPLRFNPRSHPRVRATQNTPDFPYRFDVSIHARTRGCERQALRVVCPYKPQCFNPRSHPRVRATLGRVAATLSPNSFNPRSHPRVRATSCCAHTQ